MAGKDFKMDWSRFDDLVVGGVDENVCVALVAAFQGKAPRMVTYEERNRMKGALFSVAYGITNEEMKRNDVR